MLRACILVAAAVGILAVPAPSSLKVERYFDTEGKTAADGFVSESHRVVTEDGYVLEINRIPHGRNNKDDGADRPVVFMMHGLQGSAMSYCMIGPELSPAYNLADAGYDVWLGNARGVLNSRNHVSLHPEADKVKFFDFSFEEIALKDLPVMIDYVLEYTGKGKLHYIGHSQGGTVFLILNSMKPAYNDKFESVHLLAGVGYQNAFPNAALKMAAISTDILYAFTVRLGYIEIFGPEWNEINDCSEENRDSESCQLGLIQAVIGELYSDVDVYAGASMKQFAHYGQNIRDRSFRRWNYGLLNFVNYGRLTPPSYDLKLITADVTMHYTVSDMVLSEEDVLSMAKDMPNTVARRVARDDFAHTDFATAQDAKEMVTDYIIEHIRNYKK